MAEKLYKMTPDGSFEPVEAPNEAPAEALRHVVTPSGFECDIDPTIMDDMEIVEDLAAIDAGDTLKIFSVIRRLLGEDGKKAMYDHVRTPDGRVPVEATIEELSAIITALGDDAKK